MVLLVWLQPSRVLNAYTFGLMIAVLLIRPTGLFRARGRLQETLQ